MTRSSNPRSRVTLGAILLHLLPAAVLACVFAAVGIIHVTSRVMVVDAGYRLSRLEQESRALTHTQDTLRLELATLKGPQRLEKLAREQLGMAPAPSAAVINVSPSTPRPVRVAQRGP